LAELIQKSISPSPDNLNHKFKIENSFTHGSELHPQPLIASLQLMAWLLFQPSTWRNYVTHVAPTLKPNFSLADLNREDWKNPHLRHLLFIGWGIPLFSGSLVCCVLWLLDLADPAIFFGVVAGAVIGLMFGVTISLATGIAAGITIGIAMSVVYGQQGLLAVDVVMSLMFGTIFGLGTGFASHVADNITRQPLTHSLSRQIGGIIIGLFISSVVVAVAVGGVVMGFFIIGLANNEGGAAAVALGGGLGLGLIFAVTVWRHTGQWRRGLLIGLISGVIFGVMLNLVMLQLLNQQIGGRHLALAFGVTATFFFSAMFVLAYTLTEPLAGAQAAAITGAIAGSAGHIPFWAVISLYDPWSNMTINFILVILGLSMGWWRPILMYPIQMAWNMLLWHLDRRQNNSEHSFFRWHSAFWDELQWLRLSGLDNYLIYVAERQPIEGAAAINYLTTSRQRWAAQAAQIELEARRLKQCTTIDAIRQCYLDMVTGELTGPASALLEAFRRTSQDVQAALVQVASANQRLALKAVNERLHAFGEEINASQQAHAKRFQPITEQWRETIVAYEQELARAAETNREVTNVYVFSVPLTKQQQTFVGRAQIATLIEQLLTRPETPPIVLHGQRRMGKTSFLRNLERLLPRSIIPLFVDGEKISLASSYPDFLYNLAKEIVVSTQTQKLSLPILRAEILTTEPLSHFLQWLAILEQHLRRAGYSSLLLALDEVEALESILSKGRFSETDVLETLHGLTRQCPAIKLLLTSSSPPGLFPHWVMELGEIYSIKIGYLEESEARQLIEQPVQDFPLHYEPEAIYCIQTLTHGHPHLIQLLCHEIVTLKNEQIPACRRLVRPADVEAAVPHVFDHGSFFFDDIEQKFNDSERALLHWLATRGAGVFMRPEDFSERLGTTSKVEEIIRLFTQYDLIECIEGNYCFQVELIRRWFLRQ
jgi:hypothetical protein